MFVGEIPDSDVNTIYTRFIELFEDCCARYAIQTWLKTRNKIILHLGNVPDQALIFRNSVCSVCVKSRKSSFSKSVIAIFIVFGAIELFCGGCGKLSYFLG